ncbi:Rod shape-determining protein MreB [Acaryochloris thomasi RCC1774]|uniref:Cell shape-determining protein MreB n=1 Tax=Acaryochloris thomasi RCC1774 TaxID=1764569 RepID=A0A2W1JTX3_9CYAN|nr:rod shape-determining protein [Acaryochloris thomasi]PZD72047.1 Rod shape-determining protein MreB [Acaryochloris thomasi RCC1774]
MTYTIPQAAGWDSPAMPSKSRSWLQSLKRFGRLSYDIGIDLGTSNTVIHIPEQGIVVREPSILAMQAETQEPLAIGAGARQMLGRNASDVRVERPICNGVVAEFDLAKLMLQHFLERAGARVLNPRIAVGCSSGATEVERWALTDLVLQTGARKAYLIDEPIAAAIGAGLPVNQPMGNLIIDMGGGTTEVSVVSLLGIVANAAIPIAGNSLDQAVKDYFRHTHDLRIGELMAESLKIKYGSAVPDNALDNTPVEVVGLLLRTGLTGTVKIQRGDLRAALAKPLSAIVKTVKQVLGQISPELMSDICDRGLLLTGGGALIPGLDALLRQEMGLMVHIVENPLDSVAIGASSALQNRHYENVLHLAS